MVVLLSPSMRLSAMPVRLPLALLLANSLCSNMPAPILASALLHVCVTTHMLAFAASRKALLAKRLVVGRVDLSIEFSNHVSCATRVAHASTLRTSLFAHPPLMPVCHETREPWTCYLRDCQLIITKSRSADVEQHVQAAAMLHARQETDQVMRFLQSSYETGSGGTCLQSSGGTGFGGLDNSTVAGKNAQGRLTSGNGRAVAASKQWRQWLRWPRQHHRHWKERKGAADLRERWRQAVAALASVASTTTPSLGRQKRGGPPPGAVAASSGGTGFGGLDNNTVTGKSEKGRRTSGSGGSKQWQHWLRWPRQQHRHWKE